jgi:hypothetical protein
VEFSSRTHGKLLQARPHGRYSIQHRTKSKSEVTAPTRIRQSPLDRYWIESYDVRNGPRPEDARRPELGFPTEDHSLRILDVMCHETSFLAEMKP